MINYLKQSIGALLLDMPLYVRHLFLKPKLGGWSRLHNRAEHIETLNETAKVKCLWRWTSELHLPKLFPVFGRVILQRAFRDYPITLATQPLLDTEIKPTISFIIGHRGTERVPLLLKTLESIAGQKGCQIECIVVEQDNDQKIKSLLPDWVRYAFTPLPKSDMAYSRSWAFNQGAKLAKSDRLVFHDNDMIVPDCYAAEMHAVFEQGYQFVNLKRFIFYLDKLTSSQYLQNISDTDSLGTDCIVQNLEGGGSFGACKKTFLEIGGFDERFVGWGGEDNEFWERALTKTTWEYGYLPILHLWHSSQPGKEGELSSASQLYNLLSKQDPSKRISALTCTSPP